MRYSINIIFVFLAFILSSCNVFDSEIIVRDSGFDVKADVAWNSDYMGYTLRLSLSSGEDGGYVFNYDIDSDPLVSLRSAFGGSVSRGSEIKLSASGATVFILPELSPSKEHIINMEFIREGVTRRYSLELPNTSQNEIGMRIDASLSLDYTRVTLSSLMGPSATDFQVSFYLDGNLLEGIKYMSNTFGGVMTLNFSRNSSYSFELPYLIAGEHVLRIDVQSNLGSESTSMSFIEPQRRRTSLKMSYNPFTGNLMISSDYNPTKTSFDMVIDMTVQGTITYRHPQFFGIADPQTEFLTLTSEARTTVTPTLGETQIDGGALKSLLDRMHSNTREDAANAIGNGNERTLHFQIKSIDLKYSIHSQGEYAGQTAVEISPTTSDRFPIRYTYSGDTWSYAHGYEHTLYPSFTINGQAPSSVHQL